MLLLWLSLRAVARRSLSSCTSATSTCFCSRNAAFSARSALSSSGVIRLAYQPLQARLECLLRQRLGEDVAKGDPRLLEVYNWLTAEFDNGRQTSVEWEELEPVVTRAFSPTKTPDGDLARI